MERVQTRVSIEKQHHKKSLITTLKEAYQKLKSPFLYLEERANDIVTAFLNESQIFSTGFTKIVSRNNIPEEGINRVVLVTLMGQFAMTEIERYWHLFEQILIINLTISGEETKELIRVSPLRKKLRGFLEISLNFMPFIDSVYFSTIINKQTQNVYHPHFEESLTSFLISLPKYHEFRLSLLDNSSSKTLEASLKTLIDQKLAVMETYKSKQYSSHSSPRIKVLILERQQDQMSPLLYSYHFGPIAKEIGAFDDKNTQFTIDSALFTALYPLDVEQASQLLSAIALDKAENQKTKFELHDFQKAKKVITKHYDEHSSPQQIEMQIDVLNSVKQFCQRRAFTTTLQQTIVNARSEGAQKMTASKVVDRIVQWSTIPMEEYKPSQEDYIKILILSYMVNSFWFWHRRIINAGLEHVMKEKILDYCKKVEGKFKPLVQKPQGEERFDLYRHQPGLVETVRRWIVKEESQRYIQIDINETSVNRETVVVIAVKGPLGYGELALLIKQIKKIDEKSKYIFFCQSLVTTNEYMKLMLTDKKIA